MAVVCILNPFAQIKHALLFLRTYIETKMRSGLPVGCHY
jgi:hypothetical protein